MARYSLQKFIRYEDAVNKNVEVWQMVREHDRLETLKMMCPEGFRIVDNSTGRVVWEP